MTNNSPKTSNLRPFSKGQSGNPGGKPKAARNRIQADFLNALADDFAEHGREAIIDCRTTKPDVYIKVVASLMPKKLEVMRPLEGLNDDELEACITLLRAQIPASHQH